MSNIRDGLVREVKALRQSNEKLTGALREALASMSVAHCINAVQSEYDFAPAIDRAQKALAEPTVNPREEPRKAKD